jgi:hypothetical protein
MKFRAGVLAALALTMIVDAGHADSNQPAPSQDDRPAGTESDRSSNDQPGPSPKAGNATGGATENAAEHQPAVKPEPGVPVRGSTWDTPIDTRITVNQGRTPNKRPKGIGVAVKALAQRLQNKSKTAIAPGVTIQHDAHKPEQMRLGSFRRRNAIGAGIEPHTAMDQNAAPPPGNGVQHRPFLQTAGRTPASVLAAASAATTALTPAADHGRAAQQFNHPDVTAHGAVAVPAGGPALNGTAMIRPGAATGAIGGPAKAALGVISGSNVRIRRP